MEIELMNKQTSAHKSLRVAMTLALSALPLMLSMPASADPKRVNELEGLKAVVQKVTPTYPAMARQLKLAGRVVVDMTVAEDGSVESADVVNGNPILAGAAKSAAKSWKFQPFQSEGKNSKAVVRVNFDFAN
jgi:protein TonB